MLPRGWTQKSIGPIWKAAAIAGWAIAILLAQCLVMVLAWPGLTRPAPPPLAELPPPPPVAPKSHGDLEVANSMARIRCLVAVGRSQEALAETIRCLTLCQRLQIDPPAELPALFAETVTSISAGDDSHESPRPRPRPVRSAPQAIPAEPGPAYRAEAAAADQPGCVNGRLPGPGYPQAPPRPRLAQLLPPPYLPPPPPVPDGANDNRRLPQPPQAGRYEFQPLPGAPPMPPGMGRPPGY